MRVTTDTDASNYAIFQGARTCARIPCYSSNASRVQAALFGFRLELGFMPSRSPVSSL